LGKNDLKFYLEGKRNETQIRVGTVLVNMQDKLGPVRSNSRKNLGEDDSKTGAVKKSDMWVVVVLEGPAMNQLKLFLF